MLFRGVARRSSALDRTGMELPNPYAAPRDAVASPNPTSSLDRPFTSAWDVLARSVGVYVSNFGMLVVIALVVHAPAELLVAVLIDGVGIPTLLVTTAIDMVLGAIAGAAAIHAIVQHADGNASGVVETLAAGARRAPAVLWARIAGGIAIGMGLLALIVPGLMLLVRFSLGDAVATLERPAGFGALDRSSVLVRGKGWRVSFALLTIIAVTWALGYAGVTLATRFPHWAVTAATQLLQDLVGLLIPVFALVAYLGLGGRERASAS